MNNLLLSIGLAALLSACDPSPAPTSTAVVVVTNSPGITTEPSAGPSPSPSPASSIAVLDEDDLAMVSLEDERPTAVCDQDPSNGYIGGPASQIFCYDGLQFGLRALRTRMPSVERLYLHRGSCAALPCTPTELDGVDVIGWQGDDAYTVSISWEPSFITIPIEGAVAPWPSPSSSVAPAIERPTIDGAPAVIDRREPFPYCGLQRSVHSNQSSERMFEINRCFFDGVLDGRPVEMLMITDVTQEQVLFRFDGSGFVSRYLRYGEPEAWYRDQGPVSLGGSVYFNLQHNVAGVRIDE